MLTFRTSGPSALSCTRDKAAVLGVGARQLWSARRAGCVGLHPNTGPPLETEVDLQAIATAEGFTDIGDATVVIFRNEGGQRMVAKFDIASIRSGASSDPVLQAGDTIVAPTSFTKEAFATIMKALPLATFAALAL